VLGNNRIRINLDFFQNPTTPAGIAQFVGVMAPALAKVAGAENGMTAPRVQKVSGTGRNGGTALG
jgi:hypothetical protein